MPLPEWILKFKEPKTEIKKVKGYYYKYELIYKYDSTKKRTIKHSGRILGSITEKEGFISNESKSKAKKADVIDYNSPVDIKMFGFIIYFVHFFLQI